MLWNISDVLMGVMAIINIPVFKSKDIGMKEKLDCWK